MSAPYRHSQSIQRSRRCNSSDDEEIFRAAVGNCLRDQLIVVHGGQTRQESTRLALLTLREELPECVLVHDAVRPFADHALIWRVVDAVGKRVARSRTSDTLRKHVDSAGMMDATTAATVFHSKARSARPSIPPASGRVKRAAACTFTDDAALRRNGLVPGKDCSGSSTNINLRLSRRY